MKKLSFIGLIAIEFKAGTIYLNGFKEFNRFFSSFSLACPKSLDGFAKIEGYDLDILVKVFVWQPDIQVLSIFGDKNFPVHSAISFSQK
nr:hypothetical protein [uncultured Dyadobacter sp.]